MVSVIAAPCLVSAEHPVEVPGHFGLERHRLSGGGMDKGQLIGVEAQPPDGMGAGAVLLVPGHGMALFLHMDADLVFPPRLDGDVQQGVAAPGLDHLIAGDGLFGVGPGFPEKLMWVSVSMRYERMVSRSGWGIPSTTAK